MENSSNQVSIPSKTPVAYIVFFLRVTIGIIFLISGIGKLFDISSFVDTVAKFNILPQQLIIPFSIVIPFVEVLFGAAFVSGIFVKTAGFGLAALLISFLIAIGKKISEGTPVDCGCGGVIGSDSVGHLLFFKDIGLLISVIVILSFSFRGAREATSIWLSANIFETVTAYAVCAVVAYGFFIIWFCNKIVVRASLKTIIDEFSLTTLFITNSLTSRLKPLRERLPLTPRLSVGL